MCRPTWGDSVADAGPAGGHSPVVARRIVVSGRVQGVFFRASTRDVAREHGVVGWVANRSDGAVEVWLEGAPGDVDAVESWIRAGGPRFAEVTGVEVSDSTPGGYARFDVVHG